MPERHLGLTPAGENNAREVIEKISEKIAQEVYLDEIIELAKTASAIEVEEFEAENIKKDITIGIAQDKAFSFYYPASLAQLENLGAKLKFFSPLEDEAIPVDVDALIFGGGFPEVFAQELMQNTSMIKSIRKANERKMPIYAECGGFMYLMQGIYDFEQRFYEMVGIIPAKAQMNKNCRLWVM